MRKMKKKKPYILIGIILMVGFTLLTGCSGKRSEDEIKEDVLSYLSDYLSGISFEEINVQVESREPNNQEKTECVFSSVEAENNSVTYTMETESYYYKGEKGWELEGIDVVSEDYIIKQSEITEEEAEAQYKELYANEPGEYSFTDRETDLENGTDTFYYTRERKQGYLTEVYDIALVYTFSLYDGWYFDEENSISELAQYRWDVEGKWTYTNSKSNMELNIINLSDGEAEVEYDFNYIYTEEASYNEGFEMKNVQFASDGTKTVGLSTEEEGHLILTIHENDQSYYLNLTSYGGITFDGKYGKKDTFVFGYEDGNGYQVRDENETWEDKLNLYETMPIYVAGGKEGKGMGLWNDLGKAAHDGNMQKYCLSYMQEDGGSKKASNTYELFGKYTKLTGKIFLVEGINPGSDAQLIIYGDGKKIYSKKASELSGSNYMEDLNVDITGVKELTIELSGESQFVEIKGMIAANGIDCPVLAVSELQAER